MLSPCLAIPTSAADGDTEQSDGADRSQDAAVWRVLRHRWWRDLPEAPDEPTVVVSGPDSLTVTWNTPDSATDIGGYDVEYRAEDTPEFTSFDHDEAATTTTLPDLAPSTLYHVRVRAVNDAGAGDWSPSGEGTTDNAAPYFVAGDAASRSLPENTPAGRDVGTPVTAVDAEGGALRYSLAGEDVASFDLDTATGQIRTREGADYDHETRAEMALTVSVDDGHGGTASIDVTVQVTDVDEPPGEPPAPAVAARSSTSLEVTWLEPVNGGPPIDDYDLRYREAGTADAYLDAGHVGTNRTATLADLVPATDYEVQVRAANAEAIGDWSATGRGRTLANVPPVFDEGASTRRSLAENTPTGVDIGEPVTARDADGDVLTYVLAGQGVGMFSIHASNGQLLTSENASFDHERTASHDLTITATDPHGGLASIDVTVDVTDVDEPPEIPSEPTVSAVSASTLRVVWSEPASDGPAITDYDLRYRHGTDGPVVDAGHEGSSTTATISGLAPATTYEFEVRASNAEGTSGWSATGAGATLANGEPVFDEGADTARAVTENTPGGLGIGDPVRATDPDDHPLTYSLGGPDAADFAIVSETGQVMTRDDRAYDHEAKAAFDVIVTAADGHGGRATIDVTVRVTDIDEPPGAPEPPTVSGSSSTSLDVAWSAPANSGPPVDDYDLRYRRAADGPTVDAGHEGSSTTATIAGLMPSTTYEFEVRATNDEGIGDWSHSGTGTTRDNRAPAFDDGARANRDVAEDSPGDIDIGQPVRATDPDGDTLTYSLGGLDADLFTLDPATGQLATRADAYDHEELPLLEVTVSADDGHGGRGEIDVTIRVTDVDEPPGSPEPPAVSGSSSSSLEVTWPQPSNDGPAIRDYDVRYRVADSDDAFEDAGHEGSGRAIALTGLVPSAEYAVQVRASNAEGTGAWSPPGRGTTFANQPPTFDEGTSTSRVLVENAPELLDVGDPVTATDADGDRLVYTLSGTHADLFSIHASSGQLATATGAAFDHETASRHQVTVASLDPHGGQASIDVTVHIVDVDEAPERPAAPTVTASAPTSLDVSWSEPGGGGPPVDDYDVRYRVASSDDAFTDAGHEGAERSIALTGLIRSTEYAVQVRARNEEGTGGWSDSGFGTTLANREPTFAEGTRATRELAENTPAQSDIGEPLDATDGDGDTLTFVLSGPDAGLFTVDSTTGQLATAVAAFDHETDASHGVTVTADDGHGGRATIDVTVRVTDVSEPPLAPAAPLVNAAGPDTLEVDWSAPANTGRPAITGYHVRYRSSGAFIALPGTFTATHAEIENLDAGDYEIQVRAQNDEGQGAWSASGHGTVSGNRPPVVDHGLLNDVTLTEGEDDKLVPVRAAFSDPDGDALTLGAASSDTGIVMATMSGDSVSLDAEAVGSAEVDITATDPRGATATGSFEVTVVEASTPPPPPTRQPAPTLSLNDAETDLEVEFGVSIPALETKAFRIRIRQKNQQSNLRTYCFVIRNNRDETFRGTISADIYVGSLVLANTTYLVDYRSVGESCFATATAPWSLTAEFTTTDIVAQGFDIDIVYVGPDPGESVKSAFLSALAVWERAITNDVADIDYSSTPVSNPCTDKEFDGIVDDLRIYVRVQPIDGAGGTYGTAGICESRSLSRLPIISLIRLDSDDVNQLGSSALRDVALHEIAHALGFGIFWSDLLVNPSIRGGEPVTPPPDTHFDGTNAIAAFDDVGGADYQGNKVPVENEQGGNGGQDSHWRKSVMGSELMTFSLGDSAELSAVTIQSMADLGYSVDDSFADPYTLPNTASAAPLLATEGEPLPRCIVHPPTGINFVSETRPIMIPASAIRMRAIDGSIEDVEIVSQRPGARSVPDRDE